MNCSLDHCEFLTTTRYFRCLSIQPCESQCFWMVVWDMSDIFACGTCCVCVSQLHIPPLAIQHLARIQWSQPVEGMNSILQSKPRVSLTTTSVAASRVRCFMISTFLFATKYASCWISVRVVPFFIHPRNHPPPSPQAILVYISYIYVVHVTL